MPDAVAPCVLAGLPAGIDLVVARQQLGEQADGVDATDPPWSMPVLIEV